tara:strand:- start:1005 stop:1274 length:270 start_codon:yes stop_codon:yes gene_type:complete
MTKFTIGDIVEINSDCPVYSVLKNKKSVGIIKKSARLMYIHDWESVPDEEDILKEFWAYDVVIEGQTFKNVPEETLSEFIKNEDEEDTE